MHLRRSLPVLCLVLAIAAGEEAPPAGPAGSAEVKRQVTALLEAGDVAAARDLLESHLAGNEGDAEYLFLAGTAQFESGDASAAIRHFEAALDVNPGLSRVRLDLARAYAVAGKPRSARTEFQRVLDTNPPAEVRSNIERYMASLGEAKTWRARLAVGYLYDSNVNAGPSSETVTFFGVPFALTPGTAPRSDSGVVSNFVLDHLLPFSDELGLRSTVTADTVTYWAASQFNVEQTSLLLGPQYREGRVQVGVPFAFNYSRLGSEDYGWAVGGAPEVRYAAGDRVLLIASGLGQATEYWQRPERDGSIWSVHAAVRYSLSEKVYIEAGYRHTREDTRVGFLDNDLDAVHIALYAEIPWEIAIFVRPTIAQNGYDEREAAFPRSRDDDRVTLDVNVSREIFHTGFFMSVGYTHTDNDSNLPLFEFERDQVVVQISKDF